MKSPLGVYGEMVAAGVAVAVIFAAVLSRPLEFRDPFLDVLAGIAMGAIFGSTAATNGWKVGQSVILEKLDDAARAVTDKATLDDARREREE